MRYSYTHTHTKRHTDREGERQRSGAYIDRDTLHRFVGFTHVVVAFGISVPH